MIDRLYDQYFQKSRSFLYPALGIKRTSHFVPSGTYVSIPGKIGPEEMKLICSFKENDSEGFLSFENQMLIGNPLFEEKIKIKGYNLYVFNFEIYKSDWFNFLMGKYSKFSSVLKRAIKTYYGDKSKEYRYIETYLFPDKYFETYAKLLEVDISSLKDIGELCDPWNEEKESLKIPAEDLELLTKIE